MSKVFLKINVKFHSNVITHNQTNEQGLVITLQHTLLLVINITILVIIHIQYTKRTLRDIKTTIAEEN